MTDKQDVQSAKPHYLKHMDAWVRTLPKIDLYRKAWAYRRQWGYGAGVLEDEIERRDGPFEWSP